MDSKHDSGRIAKNTIILYCRTIFTLLISLYTSRLVLEALGVVDYGVYNVVGGMVSIFSILSSSISGAISRFITFGLGESNHEKLKDIFATSITIQVIISVIVFIVTEIGGIYFLNYQLNVPSNRISAANWVLQFSIITFILGLLSVPYNAVIIAHERMKAFAVVSMSEAVVRLVFVCLVYFSSFDKLISYSFLICLLSLFVRITYGIYCTKTFKECKYTFKFNKKLFTEMFRFAGWGFFGNTAYILNTQGVNMIINIFFSVTYNAARGVVTQVENAIMQFINNFTTAISPQITKSYAAGDYEYTEQLVYKGAKFSFFLLLTFVIPIEFETETILAIWLKDVPQHAALFLRWSLICAAITVLGNTSLTAIMATGNIRNYQITVTIIGCLVFPFTWIAYALGSKAYITYVIYACVYAILNSVRIIYLNRLIGFNPINFLTKVIFPISIVTLSVIGPYYLIYILLDAGIHRFVLITACNFIITPITVYVLGIEPSERLYVHGYFKRIKFRYPIR